MPDQRGSARACGYNPRMRMIPNNFGGAFFVALLPALWLSACAVQPPVVETPAASAVQQPAIDTPAASTVEAPLDAAAVAEPDDAPVVSEYRKDDVIWIQGRLRELGYFDGAVNGAVGEKTNSAVRAYQRDQSIETDGRPTAKLREFMWRNGG